MSINSILVVIDPTKQDQPLITRAIRVARAFDARIELFIAEYHSVVGSAIVGSGIGSGSSNQPSGLAAGRSEFESYRKEWLTQLATRATAVGLNVSTHFCWTKSLYSAILQRSDEISADLIMKATHHHSILRRALFTHTDWHLIRESSAHLWLVKESFSWDRHLEVMATIDPMTEEFSGKSVATKILQLGYELSYRLPAEFSALHAYEPVPLGLLAGKDSSINDYESYRTKVRREHESRFKAALAEVGEANIKMYLDEGAADGVISEIAEQEGIDLVLIGAVSHSRIDRILVGSTAERVLENINCDVLVVK